MTRDVQTSNEFRHATNPVDYIVPIVTDFLFYAGVLVYIVRTYKAGNILQPVEKKIKRLFRRQNYLVTDSRCTSTFRITYYTYTYSVV